MKPWFMSTALMAPMILDDLNPRYTFSGTRYKAAGFLACYEISEIQMVYL